MGLISVQKMTMPGQMMELITQIPIFLLFIVIARRGADRGFKIIRPQEIGSCVARAEQVRLCLQKRCDY